MGKLICPNCKSEVALPERSEMVMGITFSEQSQGTRYLNMKNTTEYTNNNDKENNTMMNTTNNTMENNNKERKTMNAQERIEVLKAKGIDVAGYFALGDMLVRMENGVPVVVTDDIEDTIVKSIVSDGDVFNPVLDGRWIMAQMFHMLNYKGYRRGEGYNDALNAKGYNYQWNFLVHRVGRTNKLEGELVRIAKRERDGQLDNKDEFFNKSLILSMVDDYISKLETYIDSLETKYCKGVPYKRLGNRYRNFIGQDYGDVFVADLNKKVYQKYRSYRNKIAKATDFTDLYKKVVCFTDHMIKLPSNYLMCSDFKVAYKGNGVYYTAKNMIRFHGCTVKGMNKEESLDYVETMVDTYAEEHWRMLGWLKEFIEYNGFDFNKAMEK